MSKKHRSYDLFVNHLANKKISTLTHFSHDEHPYWLMTLHYCYLTGRNKF
ncbi:hypothetical protein PEC301296_07210 [Pectobacterium carotovorum subsp. carotovorum]|nr:hypothetical protein GZ59_30890 [Pectobacterium atrosepticum]KMK88459.1 hypothetical protein KCQ_01125 [Pectobacterium atrosepticum ICMP 1526]POW31460.1 hypothetical protein PB72LOC_00884 [Pectobacterium atrosepticum]GKV84409.1 hypothetical protein PEC301296_07210 [Pectobacterium carotovorum subsp. carotovorum]